MQIDQSLHCIFKSQPTLPVTRSCATSQGFSQFHFKVRIETDVCYAGCHTMDCCDRRYPPETRLSSNLPKSRLSIFYRAFVKSFYSFPQSTTVILSQCVQKVKTTKLYYCILIKTSIIIISPVCKCLKSASTVYNAVIAFFNVYRCIMNRCNITPNGNRQSSHWIF